MESSNTREEKRHPIRVAVRRTGLTPELLRVWERRYDLVSPARTETGRRLYSDLDLERLRLLRTAVLGGRRIGDISGMPLPDLRRLVEEDREDAPSPRTAPAPPSEPERLRSRCREAVGQLDSRRLESMLRNSLHHLGAVSFLEELVAPLLRELGSEWQRGDLEPEHEHLATVVLERVLGDMIAAASTDDADPAVVVATPSGQIHVLGSRIAGACAAASGWRVIDLGRDLPGRSIARAAGVRGANLVALSLIHPPADPGLEPELLALREGLPAGVPIVVGGGAADSYAAVLDRIGALLAPDLAHWRRILDAGRSEVAR